MGRKRKMSQDPNERLQQLADCPESWHIVDKSTLSQLVMWQCWNYGAYCTAELLYAIKPLYAVFRDRCPVNLRLQTEQMVVMGVVDRIPARALVPFQIFEDELSVISSS